MPKGQPSLGPNQILLLKVWIQAGAPEKAVTPPSVIEVEVEANFASLQKNVIIPYCITCHKPGKNEGAAGGI